MNEEQMKQFLELLEPNLAWNWHTENDPPLRDIAKQLNRIADALEEIAEQKR